MKLFLQYLKQRKMLFIAEALFCVVFLAAFLLYRLPAAAVLYPAAICLILGVLFFTVDFMRIRRKHRFLSGIRGSEDILSDEFLSPDSVIERDYREIIRLLCEEQQAAQNAMNGRITEMTEYYTLWAHQIKTPIAAMRLRLQNEDSAQSRALTLNLLHIEQYVEMAMMFLKLDAGSSDYVIREYDLDDVIRQALRKFAGEFIDRKLQLIYEPLNITVVTDEKWLSFVIEQILSNALKYTFAPGSITISAEEDHILCIRDTGIGIAPEDLPRIFEKGYTGYNGRSDKRASGIGLYLCKRICHNLGHTVTVQSVPGEGTKVLIDLSRKEISPE